MRHINDNMKFPKKFFIKQFTSVLLIILGLIVIDDSTAQSNSFDDGSVVISELIPGEEIMLAKAALIDIAIYSIQCGDFEVKLRPNSEIPVNTITNIQFTLKWPANSVDLIDFYSEYKVELQGSVIIENDTNYAIFVSATTVPISWFSGMEYPILSFSHDQSGIGFLDLLIDTGDWAKINNGEFYVELLGIDETGIVSQNAINILLEECCRLDLKAFLQGPYSSSIGLMKTTINDAIDLPLAQPYVNPPWNYVGIEDVGFMPGNVVDWVLVEIRDAPDAVPASSATLVNRQAALIVDNGSIVALDGISELSFNNALIQNLFVVLWHRNHLGILSSTNVIESPSDTYI